MVIGTEITKHDYDWRIKDDYNENRDRYVPLGSREIKDGGNVFQAC